MEWKEENGATTKKRYRRGWRRGNNASEYKVKEDDSKTREKYF